MICSHARLRDDRQMARRPASHVQRQKETIRKSVSEANGPRQVASQAELLCAGTVFLVALLVYSWTLAPTVTLTDSGELIVAAYGLGVAHPPGFPLWVMLAHLASLVPVGSVAVRINFSSAVFAAFACAMLTLVVAELLITASSFAAPSRRNKAARSDGIGCGCRSHISLHIFVMRSSRQKMRHSFPMRDSTGKESKRQRNTISKQANSSVVEAPLRSSWPKTSICHPNGPCFGKHGKH